MSTMEKFSIVLISEDGENDTERLSENYTKTYLCHCHDSLAPLVYSYGARNDN